jgi:hypothetical protein
MSRMLEALKQLERRGARPVALEQQPLRANDDDTSHAASAALHAFEPYGLDPPADTFTAAPYLDSGGSAAQVAESASGPPTQPSAAKNVLPLCVTGDDYQPVARQIVEIIDLQGSRIFVVFSVSAETDEALSLPTLASALAGELGRRVLLAHTDRRLRSILSNTPSEPLLGLSAVLAGAIPWPQSIHRTSQPSLDLIPRGEAPFRAEFLSELSFPGTWAADYGAVLIGCNCSSQPLAIELARAADATIFAVRNGSAHRDTLQNVGSAFQAAGARPIGCVVLD